MCAPRASKYLARIEHEPVDAGFERRVIVHQCALTAILVSLPMAENPPLAVLAAPFEDDPQARGRTTNRRIEHVRGDCAHGGIVACWFGVRARGRCVVSGPPSGGRNRTAKRHSNWRIHELATVEHGLASEDGRHHASAQAASVIRSDRVPMLEGSSRRQSSLSQDPTRPGRHRGRRRSRPSWRGRRASRDVRPAMPPRARPECLRSAAPVHTIDNPSCSEAMPPHARTKSPSSRYFRAGGAGE